MNNDRKRKFTDMNGVDLNIDLNSTDETVLKLLVTVVSAGQLIGKGGTIITNIKNTSGANLTISKCTDLFPNTQERVCLLSGTPEAICKAIEMIGALLKAPNDTSTESLRMVITSEAAGIIIGKRGENITQLKDECQCHIHISPKPSVNEFSERILQIEGTWINICKGMMNIITKNSCYPPNKSINYGELMRSMVLPTYTLAGPAVNTGAAPNGGEYQQIEYPMQVAYPTPNQYPYGGDQYSGVDSGMAAVKLYLESLCRYNAAEAHQILSSVAMLKYHNLRTIMSIAFEEVPDHIYPPPPPPQLQAITMGVPVGPIDPSGCPSAKSVALHRGNSELINKCLRSREMEIYAEVGGCGDDISQLPETLKDYVNGKVCYVDESIVGVMIGFKGMNLNEMMNLTNTTINISNKGVFADNTNNRILTISCRQKNATDRDRALCVKRAYFLVVDLSYVLNSQMNGRT